MLLYFSHSVRSLRRRGESRSGPRHSNRPNPSCVLDLLPLLSEKVSVVHFKGPTEDNQPEFRFGEPELSSVTKS